MNDADDASESQDTGDSPESNAPPETPKAFLPRRRRRPPYLLAILLTAFTVVVANMIWLAIKPVPEETGALPEPVDVLGAQVKLVREGQSNTIALSDELVTDDEVQLLQGLENLQVLKLDAGIITDKGAAVIGTLPNLLHLRLRHSPITDVGLASILKCKKLRILNLPQTNLSPAGMESLATLPDLRQLRIGGDGATDLSRSVAKITQVRALHLIDIPVTDDGLRPITNIPHLESLYLDNTRITEIGWQWLFNNHPELHVHINQRHHDNDPNFHIHGDNRDEQDETVIGDDTVVNEGTEKSVPE